MSSLPFDIMETILITVFAQDTMSFPSTKACALVCHEFHQICRKLIFASISLDYFSPPCPGATIATPAMLQQLLDTSPDIADHICYLNYDMEYNGFRDSSLLESLRKITHLKVLGIAHLQWNNHPLRPVLLHLLHLPTLIHFRLHRVRNFILSDLAPCMNLEVFQFHFTTVLNANESSASNLPEKSLRLRNISMRRVSDMLNTMCAMQCADGKPFIDFSRLDVLSIALRGPDDVQAAHGLLSRCEWLTSISMDFLVWDGTVNYLTHIGLARMLYSSMQTLKHLDLDTSFDEGKENDDPSAGLASDLEQMKHNNIIETINIGVITTEKESDCRRGEVWSCLDTALAQPGWPKLQRVSLTIIVQRFSRVCGDMERALKELPQTQLSKLSSNKFISFEFDVRGFYVD